MRRAGTIDRVANGVGVIRTDDPPDVGTDLVDAHLGAIGQVVDVFGPVDRPFVAVAPADGWDATDLLDVTCYVRESAD